MAYWGNQSAFWSGLSDVLVGSAFFWVPGIGPLLVAGPLVSWIVARLKAAQRRAGYGPRAGLYSIGIPKNSVLQYETEVKNRKILLLAQGTPEEVERAKDILQQTQAKTTTVHAQSAAVGA